MGSKPREATGSTPHSEPLVSRVTRRGEARLSPVRVLIVEDDTNAALLLKQMLELFGHAVEVASCGLEGLAKARALRPDVVISDLDLPDIDGCVVAEALRADPTLGAVPLIALSGQCLPGDVARSKRAGFDFHIAKPPQLYSLNALLSELAGGRPGVSSTSS